MKSVTGDTHEPHKPAVTREPLLGRFWLRRGQTVTPQSLGVTGGVTVFQALEFRFNCLLKRNGITGY
jgi:hypothetical protein